ncbi:hypothetical protein [Aegicerativicinus sediminis]
MRNPIILISLFAILTLNCSSDDDDCPDSMVVDINDPESLAEAEKCGLSPAEPLGTLWVSDNYIENRSTN